MTTTVTEQQRARRQFMPADGDGALVPGVRVLVLVGCSKAKQDARSIASELYISRQFKASWAYARLLRSRFAYDVGILSALHGVVDPEAELDPYDETKLDSLWGERVAGEVFRARGYLRAIVLAGARYSDPIRKAMVWPGCSMHEPLRGLGTGDRYARTIELTRTTPRADDGTER